VLATADWELSDTAAGLWNVLEALPRHTCHLLVQPSWLVDDDDYTQKSLQSAVEAVRNRFEHVEVVVLAPTTVTFETLKDSGVAALYCSQNAFVREDIFFPMPGRRPTFDAIYDAKWADYKRHQLAGAVESLALLTYVVPDACTVDYFQMALTAVRHATWFTRPWVADSPFLPSVEVNAAYNKSRVGLCLSAVEGTMYASIQYLLAGLPVVTTHNRGGRDEFLSPTTARWVDADAEAVAAAVADLVRHPIDPVAIRLETLAKISEHRGRLREWMLGTVDESDARARRWHAGWPPDLPNKLMDYRLPAHEVVRLAGTDGPADGSGWASGDDVAPRVVLTEEEIARFGRDGYLVVDRPLVTSEELKVVRQILEDLLDRFHDLPDDLAYDLGDVKVHEGPPQIPEINRALDVDPRLGETAAFARIQELAHQLLSGRAFCNYDHAIFKPPNGDTTVHWHQDLAYAPELERSDEVHIWLALQDVDEANGCMRYIPTAAGSRLLPHQQRGPSAHSLVTDHVDTSTAVSCPLAAGMATVHRPATPHSTGPNTTDEARAAWILHFVDNGP
jgi:phytanoyl-CoA dioxygenase PhyH